MKRSEMIEKLEHRILTGPLRKSAKHLASDYIAVLEEAGMLPPPDNEHERDNYGDSEQAEFYRGYSWYGYTDENEDEVFWEKEDET